MRKWAGALLLITFILSTSSFSQGQQKVQDPGELYDAGTVLFHKASYEEAIDRFSKLILFFPTSKLRSYSRYMIGQCYLKMRKYEEAVQQFELYLKAFPDGDRIDEATKGIEFSKEKLKEKASPPAPSPQPVTPGEPRKKSDEVKRLTPQPQTRSSCVWAGFDLATTEGIIPLLGLMKLFLGPHFRRRVDLEFFRDLAEEAGAAPLAAALNTKSGSKAKKSL